MYIVLMMLKRNEIHGESDIAITVAYKIHHVRTWNDLQCYK